MMLSLWLWVLVLGIAVTEGVPIVNTIYGAVSGRTRTLHTGVAVEAYYGIPYARPPVGDLRWRPPQEPDPWEEVFVATELPSACPQNPRGLMMLTHPLWDNYDEDCLSINIFAPNSTTGAPYPVMVWFHGGAYQGSANVQYPGYYLAGKDVVVAIPNYRLGNLGYASTEDDASPGNYGLLDQIHALEFVRDNIAAFGGDPNKVTIFGQSAGAASTGLLTVSPRAQGLFHQAIMESGSDMAMWAVNYPAQEPANYTRQVALKLGCPIEDSYEMMDCMRQLPFDEVRQTSFTCKPGHFCLGMAPVVDGPNGVLPDIPWNLRKQGEFPPIPMINGHCKDDGSPYTIMLVPGAGEGFNRTEFLQSLRTYLVGIFAPTWPDHEDDMFEAFNFYYTPWPHIEDRDLNRDKFNEMVTDFGFGFTGDQVMKYQSEVSDVYFYVLGYRSSKAAPLIPEWLGVPHNGEIPYVLGWPFLQYDPLIRLDSGMLIDIIQWDEEDVEWAEYFTTMWTNFAKYGNPTPQPVPSPGINEPTVWPKFSADDQQYLYADRQISYMEDYRQRNFAFITHYLPYVVGRREAENPTRAADMRSSKAQGMSSDFVEKGFSQLYQKMRKS